MDNMTRKEASAKGLKQYSTGRPCQIGHMSPRYVANGVCTACDQLIQWRKQHDKLDPQEQLVREVRTARLAQGGTTTAEQGQWLGLHWFKRRTTCGHDIVHLDGIRCANHGDCKGIALANNQALDLLA